MEYLELMATSNPGWTLKYPETEAQLKDSLVEVAVLLNRHEKFTKVWSRQVSLSRVTRCN
jgi:hypothetical protein